MPDDQEPAADQGTSRGTGTLEAQGEPPPVLATLQQLGHLITRLRPRRKLLASRTPATPATGKRSLSVAFDDDIYSETLSALRATATQLGIDPSLLPEASPAREDSESTDGEDAPGTSHAARRARTDVPAAPGPAPVTPGLTGASAPPLDIHAVNTALKALLLRASAPSEAAPAVHNPEGPPADPHGPGPSQPRPAQLAQSVSHATVTTNQVETRGFFKALDSLSMLTLETRGTALTDWLTIAEAQLSSSLGQDLWNAPGTQAIALRHITTRMDRRLALALAQDRLTLRTFYDLHLWAHDLLECDTLDPETEATRRLLGFKITQGDSSVEDYAIRFRQEWKHTNCESVPIMMEMFRKGLNHRLRNLCMFDANGKGFFCFNDLKQYAAGQAIILAAQDQRSKGGHFQRRQGHSRPQQQQSPGTPASHAYAMYPGTPSPQAVAIYPGSPHPAYSFPMLQSSPQAGPSQGSRPPSKHNIRELASRQPDQPIPGMRRIAREALVLMEHKLCFWCCAPHEQNHQCNHPHNPMPTQAFLAARRAALDAHKEKRAQNAPHGKRPRFNAAVAQQPAPPPAHAPAAMAMVPYWPPGNPPPQPQLLALPPPAPPAPALTLAQHLTNMQLYP